MSQSQRSDPRELTDLDESQVPEPPRLSQLQPQMSDLSELTDLDESQVHEPPSLSLPVTTSSSISADCKVALFLKVGAEWVPVLQIPKEDIQEYALKPYKWLWFLGFILYGNIGSIASEKSGGAFSPEFMNGTLDLHHHAIYYSSPGEEHLFDPDAAQTRTHPATSDRSSMATSRAKLRDDVLSRDGNKCVISDLLKDEEPIETCHLIQREKGTSYITRVTSGPNNIVDDDGVVGDIDDLRNMMSIHTAGHKALDSSKLALLLTPNGLLQRDDIPISSVPARRPGLPGDTSFLTVQFFPSTHHGVLRGLTPHNSDVWQPTDKQHWPTRTIFNYTYARAVLKRWKHLDFSQYSSKAKKKFIFQAEENPEDQTEEKNRERDARCERRGNDRSGGGNDTRGRGNGTRGRGPGTRYAGLTCGGFLLEHLLCDDPGPAESIFLAIQGMKMERGEVHARVERDDYEDEDEFPLMIECSMDEAEKEKIEGWRQNVS